MRDLYHNVWVSESTLTCSLAVRLIRTPSSDTRLPHLSPPSPQTELGQKLSLCSKLCFAIGGAPKEVAASATAFFLQIYLLDIAQVTRPMSNSLKKKRENVYLLNVSNVFLCIFVSFSPLQINAVQASMVLFIGKAWGAVTDPIVGFFITKSRWTKIGRLMPW